MFENLFDSIKKAIDDNKDKSPEELDKLFFDENGKPNEDLFGCSIDDLRNEIINLSKSFEPTDFSDLTKYSDDELFDNLPEFLFDNDLSGAKKTAHIVFEFDMEFGNGGVSQYFANTRGEHTNELATSLEAVGAIQYARVCGEFIKKYNIKPEDFNDNIKNYFKIAESMYPYEELENAIDEFYMTDMLQDYIVKYVRANASEIVQ